MGIIREFSFGGAFSQDGAHGDDKLDQLHRMLSRIPSMTDDDIAAGIQLTGKGLEKVGKKLGVDQKEVELLLAKLRTHLRGDDSLTEDDDAPHDRYSYEAGFLNDVTIFDGQTSRSVDLAGSRGSQFLTAIANTADPQALMARFFPVMESDHGEALARTGFWGEQGSGCIVLARSTNRFLIAHRSQSVEQPNTWGTWGGAVDDGETPEASMLRELGEESGYYDTIEKVVPLFVFKKDSFRYSNFLVIVPEEFEPHVDWEVQGSRWCEFGKWPSPMHFGLEGLLKDQRSVATIKAEIKAKPLDEDEEEIYRVPDSFDDEITKASGTFNFHWTIGRNHGFACARYSGRGPKMTITILSVKDSNGQKVDFKPFATELVAQAKQSMDDL